VDQAVGNWRNIARARLAYTRLKGALQLIKPEAQHVQLPAPKGYLDVKSAVLIAPNAEKNGALILSGVSFSLQPGDGLGVIGPSASGKSSLAKLLTGLWHPAKGEVRIDGARFDQWPLDSLGKHIGYLPQTVELLPGTIAQNIARFDGEATDEAIISAAQLAGVHELVLGLEEGYSTQIDDPRTVLSGGQIQRIALARAVYGRPRLVILDEPNSNLDSEGEEALTKAISALRQDGAVVVVMAHRPSAISAVNLLLMLNKGQQVEFGIKEDILKKVTRPVLPNAVQA
jgi:ABC-type protease/lipase transport system fused ATPase/permease subunit